MFSLEEAQRDLKKGCKYLMGENVEWSSRSFSAEPTIRTRGNGHRLEHSKFNLDPRKHLAIIRVAQHWNGLTRQVVKSPSSWTWSGAACCSKPCFSKSVRQSSLCSPEHLCEWIHDFCDAVKGLIGYFIHIIIGMFMFSYVYVWNQLVNTGDTSSIPVLALWPNHCAYMYLFTLESCLFFL